MAGQISINTEQADAIYKKAKALTGEIRSMLSDLDKEINDLPDRGEWKGAAADKFMGVYSEMRAKVTTDFPQVLDDLSENLDKNLANLIRADNAGAN